MVIIDSEEGMVLSRFIFVSSFHRRMGSNCCEEAVNRLRTVGENPTRGMRGVRIRTPFL